MNNIFKIITIRSFTNNIIKNINNNSDKDENGIFYLNSKLLLGITDGQARICKILGCIDMFFFLVLLIIMNIFIEDSLFIRIFCSLLFILFSLGGLFLILFPNVIIEINNQEISKTNIFKKRKKIGNLSNITNFKENQKLGDVIVYKENKILFKFPINGRKDNYIFHSWLKINIIN